MSIVLKSSSVWDVAAGWATKPQRSFKLNSPETTKILTQWLFNGNYANVKEPKLQEPKVIVLGPDFWNFVQIA